MAMPGVHPRDYPRTQDEIYTDYEGRWRGIIRALTTDSGQFFHRCNPANAQLCLYGHANGTWEVKPPDDEFPPEVPEPVKGINLRRDQMEQRQWILYVAKHSNHWLIAMSYFFAAYAEFDKANRIQLFNRINDLPSLDEVVTRAEECAVCHQREAHAVVEAAVDNWIGCDFCYRWFHYQCVDVTQDMANDIEHYECPICRDN